MWIRGLSYGMRMRALSVAERSAPGKRGAARRVQPPVLVTVETERREQLLGLTEELACHQLADADHLVAVVGVGDDVGVAVEGVEHRKAVRREAAEASRG